MSIKYLIKRLPFFPKLHQLYWRLRDPYALNPFLSFAAPGHFYSPIPCMKDIDENKGSLFDNTCVEVPGIDLNSEEQCELVRLFGNYCNDIPFTDNPNSQFRYYYDNGFFQYGDALPLYSMIRHFRPNKIIEVGSGYSSALMLDVNDLLFDTQIKLAFIEPYPVRLHSLLSQPDIDRSGIITDRVQNVSISHFRELNDNDILFIDSSHVSKIGSDVNFLISTVLPQLNKGVLIHIHDIFWPFEYPERWIRGGRAWNENYIVKSFLQFNQAFKILFFNLYLTTHHENLIRMHIPRMLQKSGNSLWMRKIL